MTDLNEATIRARKKFKVSHQRGAVLIELAGGNSFYCRPHEAIEFADCIKMVAVQILEQILKESHVG